MFPVDIVYTWVNGNDPRWRKKKNTFLGKSDHHEEIAGEARFRDDNELLYSIRSVSKNCSWVNKIFIVTDNQKPEWLNIEHDKIQIVDHIEIFGNSEFLPTFNSNAIEQRLHHIPGLSEHFIYFNDDMFIGREVDKTFFFDSQGRPKLFTSPDTKKSNLEKIMNPEKLVKKNPYQYAILKDRMLVQKKSGILIKNAPIHGIKPHLKSKCFEIEREYKEEIETTLKHQLRTNDDIYFQGLYIFHAQAVDKDLPISLKAYRKDLLRYYIKWIRKGRDYVYAPLDAPMKRIVEKCRVIKRWKPAMFCLNDYATVGKETKEKMLQLLSEMYPEKCQFEKEIDF